MFTDTSFTHLQCGLTYEKSKTNKSAEPDDAIETTNKQESIVRDCHTV